MSVTLMFGGAVLMIELTCGKIMATTLMMLMLAEAMVTMNDAVLMK